MIEKYFIKSFWRDFKPKIRIFLGIAIILSFVTGLINYPQIFQDEFLQSKIEAYPFDFQAVCENIDLNKTNLLKNDLNERKIPLERLYPQIIYDGSDFGLDYFRKSFLFSNDEIINYSQIMEREITANPQYPEKIFIIGIDPDIIQDSLYSSKLQSLFQSDLKGLDKPGVLISANYKENFPNLDSNFFNFGEFEIHAFSSENEILAYTHAELYNIPILGNFSVKKTELSYLTNFISGQNEWKIYYDNAIILLGNINYIQEFFFNPLKENITSGYYSYFNILFQRNQLKTGNIANLKNQVNSFLSKINENEIIPLSQSEILWFGVIENYEKFLLEFQIICIFISIPILLFGIIFFYNLYKRYFIHIHPTLTLMRTQGVSDNKIIKCVLSESLIYGFIGGIFSTCGSILISYSLLEHVILPINLNSISEVGFFQAISFEFILNILLLSVLSAILISLICISYPLIRFLRSDLEINIKSDHLQNSKVKSRRKLWIILYLISILPIISLIIYKNSNVNTIDYFVSNPILLILAFFTTIFAPFSPFLLIISSISLISNFLIFIFEKKKENLEKLFKNSFILRFSIKKIIRNKKKFLTIMILIAFSSSFIILSKILADSEREYLNSIDSYESANGDLINLGMNYNQSEFNDLLNDLKSKSKDYHFSKMNWQITLPENDVFVNGNKTKYFYLIKVISEENHANLVTIPDNWFINGSSKTILNQLAEPNTVIIPESLQSLGMSIGSQIIINYLTEHNETINKSLEVIGIYKIFPLTEIYRDTNDNIFFRHLIVSNNTISNAKISQTYFTFYNEGENPPDIENLQSYFQFKFPESTVSLSSMVTGLFDFHSLELEQSVLMILENESVYFFLMTIFGIYIILDLKSIEETKEIAHLKSLGLFSSEILKIQIIQNSFFIFFGMLISLVGIVASMIINFFIELINSQQSEIIQRNLIINWGQIFIIIGLTMVIFEVLSIIQISLKNKHLETESVLELNLKSI